MWLLQYRFGQELSHPWADFVHNEDIQKEIQVVHEFQSQPVNTIHCQTL